MVLYGMPRHGPLKMENIKLIIGTNHLSQGTLISKQVVVQPIHQLGATLCQPLHLGPVG
jgi:hypothetical protein